MIKIWSNIFKPNPFNYLKPLHFALSESVPHFGIDVSSLHFWTIFLLLWCVRKRLLKLMKWLTQSHREPEARTQFFSSCIALLLFPLYRKAEAPCSRHEAPCISPVPAALHPCPQPGQATDLAIAPSPPGCCWLFSASVPSLCTETAVGYWCILE